MKENRTGCRKPRAFTAQTPRESVRYRKQSPRVTISPSAALTLGNFEGLAMQYCRKRYTFGLAGCVVDCYPQRFTIDSSSSSEHLAVDVRYTLRLFANVLVHASCCYSARFFAMRMLTPFAEVGLMGSAPLDEWLSRELNPRHVDCKVLTNRFCVGTPIVTFRNKHEQLRSSCGICDIALLVRLDRAHLNGAPAPKQSPRKKATQIFIRRQKALTRRNRQVCRSCAKTSTWLLCSWSRPTPQQWPIRCHARRQVAAAFRSCSPPACWVPWPLRCSRGKAVAG
jgi:hypothetical protein